MISNMNIYQGAFVNTESDVLNQNIQQIIGIKIFDTETVVDNPYNVRFIVGNNGDGTQNITVWSDPFPDIITAAAFGYFSGGDWVDVPLNLTGRTVITIPEGDWLYSFIVTSDAGDTRRLFTAGQTISLEMADTPLKIQTIDNAEDTFTVIKSKQAEILIHSGNGIDISVFAEGGDNRFYVEIETQAEGIIFKGFLSTADLRQTFMPDPNIILLTATDGLGFLENEALVNFQEVTPTDKHTIIDFIVWALGKTGLSLSVKVCMNIRENDAVPLVSDADGAGHFYKFIYVDSKTFEAEIGTCEDCFKVLEKILGENSNLYQYKGQWLIMRPDEMETGHEYYFTTFDYQGNFVSNTTETFSKDVGVNLALSWMNDDAELSLDRPYKSIIEKFNYKYPAEIVCNIDFSRGVTEITPPDLTAADSTGTYQVDCWFVRRISGSITSTIYIEKRFEFGYEKDRYLVITPKAGTATPYDFAQSVPIEVTEGDKIDFGVDWRFRANIPGASSATYFPCQIYILADNGDRYYWYNPDTPILIETFKWVKRDAIDGEANFYMPSIVQADYKYTDWTTVNASLDQAPVTGQLFIGLIQLHQGNDAGDDQDGFFSNLSVTIRPLINGSFQNYIGQSSNVTQDNSKVKAVRDKEVFLSDAPRVAMKGALLKEGAGLVIYAGDAAFGNVGQFEIAGNVFGLFMVGQTITITGSVSNNITAAIVDVNYSIIGDATTVYTDGVTVNESTVAITVTQRTYVLAGLFYNAALHTSGPSAGDLMPFGTLQAFDIWNQFNRVMRTFEGTIDRTDSSTQLPDLLHKYILKDINPNTTNGSTQFRIFILLHFDVDFLLCSWGAFFREVFNTDKPKIYETFEFKYLTQDS